MRKKRSVDNYINLLTNFLNFLIKISQFEIFNFLTVYIKDSSVKRNQHILNSNIQHFFFSNSWAFLFSKYTSSLDYDYV